MRRLSTISVLIVLGVLLDARGASAHGIGGRADLPVPLSFFLIGAGVALVISFLALAMLWPEPRFQSPRAARPIASPWLPPLRGVLRVIGVAALVLVIVAGLADGNERALNIGPLIVWIVFWLVIPFAAALIGNVWTSINPWDTLARGMAIGTTERPDVIARVGVWPAAGAFLAFTWLELVYPDSGDPRVLTAAAVLYSVYVLVVMRFVGRKTGGTIGEAFTVYIRLLSSISPFGTVDGKLVWRGWLRALPTLPQWKGLWAFVVLMVATVSYDGLSGSEIWFELTNAGRSDVALGTAGLLGTVAVIGGGYWLASFAAARLAESEKSPGEIANDFAHTLVPIALAYAVAHYFTLVLFEGQQLFAVLSDPFSLGWDLFGTATWRVNVLLSPEAVWYIQVAVIVLGHVAGVVLAHDRALARFEGENAVRSQYAMLILMVALTSLGLFILAG